MKNLDTMPPIEGDISILFSGGLDSTSLALMLGEKVNGRIHLLTMLHGHGHFASRLALRPVRGLQKVLGDRIEHHFVDIHDMFHEVVYRNYYAEMRVYGFQIACCLGCHMCFAAAMTIYNLEHGIRRMAIASCPHDASDCFNGHPESVRAFRDIYDTYGISYSHPLIEYDIQKEDESELLKTRGIPQGRKISHRTLGTQPLCSLGLLWTWPDIFVDVKPNYDAQKIRSYVELKRPLIHAAVAEHFRKQGKDVREVVRQLGWDKA